MHVCGCMCMHDPLYTDVMSGNVCMCVGVCVCMGMYVHACMNVRLPLSLRNMEHHI